MVKISPFNAVGVGSISGQGAKTPHASWLKTQNTKQKQYCKKFNKDLKKVVHMKKKKLQKKWKPSEPPSERDNVLMNWKTHFEEDANSPQIELYYRFYRVSAVKIKISAGFPEINKLIFKTFYREAKNFESPKHSLKK